MQFIAFTFGFQVVSERVGIVVAFFVYTILLFLVRFLECVIDRVTKKKQTNNIQIESESKSKSKPNRTNYLASTQMVFSNVSRYGNVAHINAYFLCSISIGTHVLIWYACECVFLLSSEISREIKDAKMFTWYYTKCFATNLESRFFSYI